MCRLFAYNGDFSVGELKEALLEFSKLSKEGCVPCGITPGHRDGWGLYGTAPDKEIFFKSATPPAESDIFETIAPLANSSGQMIAHLRKATVGTNDVSNTHPFLRSGIAFCHNGSIKVFPETDFMEGNYLPEGHTDSELFFLRILDRTVEQVVSLETLKKALLEEVSAIKKMGVWTSLTCLLKTKEGILLHYLWNEEHSESEKMEFEKYYTFYIGKKNGLTILCSERLPIEGFTWEKLANNTSYILPAE